jgi:hypothetical protein
MGQLENDCQGYIFVRSKYDKKAKGRLAERRFIHALIHDTDIVFRTIQIR